MSFAYLALFTGDYLKDTRHLSPQKHGVYLLLLIHCWDTRGPAPLDEQECAGVANCRSVDEIESLRYVLGRYFVRLEDGWYNERMVKEIEKAEVLSTVWSDAGKRGAQARKALQAKAKPRLSQGAAKAKPRTLSSSSSSSSSLPSSSSPKSEAIAPSPTGIDAVALPTVISIPLNDSTEFRVTEGMVSEWTSLYPAVDILQTLREIRGWNIATPSKRKTRTGVLKHINWWLAKEQNSG